MPDDFPPVFVSATMDDLVDHRAAAIKAIHEAQCHPVSMEYFSVKSSTPVEAGLAEVARCQALVVVSAHRFGWVPPGQDKSITWLECLHARKLGIPVFAFVVDPDHPWPDTGRENYRTFKASVEGGDVVKVDSEVKQAQEGLRKFQAWLGERILAKFTDPRSLQIEVLKAVRNWRAQPATPVPQGDAEAAAKYLDHLREITAWVDLRGLKVGSNKATRVEIEDIYVPVKFASAESGPESGNLPLERALSHRLLVIQGDPGSGKTTFLRRMVRELCRKDDEPSKIDLPVRAFPFLIRVVDLDQHIQNTHGGSGAPSRSDSRAWIANFLAAERKLPVAWVERQLESGGSVVFLDGLDEAGTEPRRRVMARLVEEAARDYPKCRFVVTTRPHAYQGEAVLAGFELARIEDLDDDAVDRFLTLWSRCLHDTETAAESHRANLRRALDGKPEIRRMARNPVMLTALAVVHWNDARLPEQRADLYESVLVWLARAREKKPGRMGDATCLDRLGELALGMQRNPGGRLTQVERGAAADMLVATGRFEKKEALSVP